MKNRIVLVSLTTIFISLIFISGCRKEDAEISTTVALDNSIAQAGFNDMHSVVIQEAADNGFAGLSQGTLTGKTSDCAVVTFSEPLGTYPNTMTIDFGDGCTGYYGIERSGIITATFTGPYKDAGTVITIVPDDYHVSGNLVEGTKTITNTGLNASGNIVFDVVVTDGKITLEDGSTIEWDADRDREWIEGDETIEISDDVYLITGGSEGINREDIAFTETITTALRVELDCRYIVSGVREITPDGEDARVIDYGDGDCDNKITVTIDGTTYEIILPF